MSTCLKRSQVITVVILLVIGLAASSYLTLLDIRVRNQPEGGVESFCAVNDTVNCVTVAQSEYSTILNLPIALLGFQFYLLLLVLIYLAGKDRFPLKNWHSYVFTASALSLLLSLWLAYVSVFLIKAVCIVCWLSYLVNFLLFLILGSARKWNIKELVVSGLDDIWNLCRRQGNGRVVFFLLLLLGVSQFIWVPGLIGIHSMEALVVNPTYASSSDQGSGLSFGPKDAAIVIKEYTDFQCPFCVRAHYIIKRLLTLYPDDIYHEFHNYPLDSTCNPHMSRSPHPYACEAASYAICAAKQGKFRVFQEYVWSSNGNVDSTSLAKHAETAGLDLPRIRQCLENPDTLAEIHDDIRAADEQGGVSGTPTFFVNGEKLVGAKPLEFWERKVREILGKNQSSAQEPS